MIRLVTFTVMCRKREDATEKRILVEGLQSPVLPRVGDWIDHGGGSYPVEEVFFEFDENKQLKYVLVEVYG